MSRRILLSLRNGSLEISNDNYQMPALRRHKRLDKKSTLPIYFAGSIAVGGDNRKE